MGTSEELKKNRILSESALIRGWERGGGKGVGQTPPPPFFRAYFMHFLYTQC